MSRIQLMIPLIAACAGGVADDSEDTNPLIGDRVVDAVLTFAGHEDLDGFAFQSTTAAGNRYKNAGPDGRWLFQLSAASDVADPSVNVGFTLVSPTGIVEPGVFPVAVTPDDVDPTATLILSAGSNSSAYSVTGTGANGTFTLDSLEGGRAAGSFSLTGDAGWTAGSGAMTYDLEGTFSEVPITEI